MYSNKSSVFLTALYLASILVKTFANMIPYIWISGWRKWCNICVFNNSTFIDTYSTIVNTAGLPFIPGLDVSSINHW